MPFRDGEKKLGGRIRVQVTHADDPNAVISDVPSDFPMVDICILTYTALSLMDAVVAFQEN